MDISHESGKKPLFAEKALEIKDICDILLSYILIQDAINIQKNVNISSEFDSAIRFLINKKYSKVIDVALGKASSLVCYENALFGCGSNNHGSLGHGDNTERFSFHQINLPAEIKNIKKIFQGDHHTMVLTNNNELYACGLNSEGQLGLGTAVYEYNTFQKIKLPIQLRKIETIICAHEWTCLISDKKDFYFAGSPPIWQNDFNQRSFTLFTSWQLTSSKAVIGGSDHLAVMTMSNNILILKSTDMRYVFEPLLLRFPFTDADNIDLDSICSRYKITAFIKKNIDNVAVYCYEEEKFQTGKTFKKINLSAVGKVKRIACTQEHLFLLTHANKVYCYANGEVNEVSTANVLSPIKSIQCGAHHVMLIAADNTIYAYSPPNNPYNGYGIGIDQKEWKEAYGGFTMVKSLPVAYLKKEEKKPAKNRNNVYFYAAGAFIITLGLFLFKKWHNSRTQQTCLNSFTEETAKMASMSMLH